ncbi:NAD(P)-dependent oxidoreductase [Dermatophilus congolensis]|uniref:Glyoxylate/hydroxypyruvate reductase A n=1 Tax=Dermatophilus congolensis TaxID=1863 RepID=A0A239VBN6_9MICO|nr:NAD(P)-dependent oxidoreductase [Dermatophilus congolensis]MBO3130584.1 phosphoglycerate dehydrogenase [Dermatophilus congolensis]MBO3130786.1 phosphoglycerate dehydrogenase [Dermatophilus congolensis]MBO3135057.1 phosphoglycerate dehydrogenase [Dermatophilus congolensis]MBO3137296.1 phosphoglycerate dehydrogenase [Dermatophilus congolensis]MBO3139540.1 phosphoglycerate dehydrogenase [Dermatophilus congolensis]
MKVLLPVEYTGPAPIFPAGSGVEVVRYSGSGGVPPQHRDAQVLVVWGQGPQVLADAAARMNDLRLVQALAAGPDAVLAAEFGEDVTVCTGVGLHDRPVAEHALALVLALLRQFPQAWVSQERCEWNEDIGGVQTMRRGDGRATTLIGARVTVWGFGSIGQTLAPVLQALGAQVTGVARSAGERAGFPVVTSDQFASVLPRTDVLVMVLPHSASTAKALDAGVIDLLPDTALVVNVGRGSTVDEDALVAALRQGRLGGAALDVASVEPLPSHSPLWSAPNVFITPHAAGGRPLGADELIVQNVMALRQGRPLRNVCHTPSGM